MNLPLASERFSVGDRMIYMRVRSKHSVIEMNYLAVAVVKLQTSDMNLAVAVVRLQTGDMRFK